MTDTVIGKVSLTPKGPYSAAAQYEPLDVVSYQGSSYIVRKPCTGITPQEGETYMLAAAKGEQGDTGGVTMEQVNAAIDEAITGAIEEVYYGTQDTV